MLHSIVLDTIMLSAVVRSLVMVCVVFTNCHCGEFSCAGYRYAECSYSERRHAEFICTEYSYAKSSYAECYYTLYPVILGACAKFSCAGYSYTTCCHAKCCINECVIVINSVVLGKIMLSFKTCLF